MLYAEVTVEPQLSWSERLRAPRREGDIMTAYWIATYDEVTDPDKVAAYAAIAGPALIAAGGTFLARGNPEQVYELGEETRTVLIEFPSVDAARAAHDSPAYAEALGGAGRRRPARHPDRAGGRVAALRRQRRSGTGGPRPCPGTPSRPRPPGASATSRSGTSMIQKPPMCSFDSG